MQKRRMAHAEGCCARSKLDLFRTRYYPRKSAQDTRSTPGIASAGRAVECSDAPLAKPHPPDRKPVACAHRRSGGARLSDQAGAPDRAVHPGRQRRHRGAHRRGAAWRTARPAGRGRQQAGRQRHHRDRTRREGASRRAYAADDVIHPHHEPVAAQAAVRSQEFLHPGRAARQGHQRAEFDAIAAGQLGAGADRARQGEAEAVAFANAGRHLHACRRYCLP